MYSTNNYADHRPFSSNSANTSENHTQRGNTTTRTVDGKDVEVLNWDGPDDPENPYATINRLRLPLLIECQIQLVDQVQVVSHCYRLFYLNPYRPACWVLRRW